jgi:hypothetical protein
MTPDRITLNGLRRPPTGGPENPAPSQLLIRGCGVQIHKQGRDLGIGRDLPNDGVLKMNAFN